MALNRGVGLLFNGQFVILGKTENLMLFDLSSEGKVTPIRKLNPKKPVLKGDEVDKDIK